MANKQFAAEKGVIGFADLNKKLDALGDPKAARKVIRSALNAALTPVVQSARANVPVGTEPHKTYRGRLVAPGFASRSIKKNIKIIGNSIFGTVGLKGEAFYALFFEKEKPWLEPALADNKDEVMRRFSESMEKWIRKVAKK